MKACQALQKVKDINLKLAILDELFNLKKFKYSKEYVEELHKKYESREEDEYYEPIRELVEYFLNLDIDPKHLLFIKNLDWPGGNKIITLVNPNWDGEDFIHDIKNLDGIEMLKNLKSIRINVTKNVNFYPLTKISTLDNLDILISDGLNLSEIGDISWALDIKKLKKININKVALSKTNKEILQKLISNGVSLDKRMIEIIAKDDIDLQILILSKSIDKNKEDTDLYNQRAELYGKKRMYKEKIADLTEIIHLKDLSDNKAGGHYFESRALCYIELKEYKDTLADMLEALKRDKPYESGYDVLCKIYIELNDYESALASYYQIKDGDPVTFNIDSSFFKNRLSVKQRLKVAEDSLNKSRNPEEVLTDPFYLYLDLKRFDDAKKVLIKLKTKYLSDEMALYYNALLFEEMKDDEKLLEAIDVLMNKHNPKNPEIYTYLIYEKKAKYYFDKGKYKEALQEMQTGLEKTETSIEHPRIYITLAEIYAKLNIQDKVYTNIQKALVKGYSAISLKKNSIIKVFFKEDKFKRLLEKYLAHSKVKTK